MAAKSVGSAWVTKARSPRTAAAAALEDVGVLLNPSVRASAHSYYEIETHI